MRLIHTVPRLLCAMAVVLTVMPSLAAGATFNERLRAANEKLRSGDTDGALAAYRDLQVDQPESEMLYYGMGCAQYDAAEQHIKQEHAEDATAALEAARDAFAKASTAQDDGLRTNAAYNEANAVAQLALQQAASQDYEAAISSLEDSVAQYEAFLERHPDHAGARQNLDHVRYQLKQMLQNPPPPPEEQEQQQQQEQQDQQNQEEQQDQQQAQEQQGQQGSEEQQDEQQEKQEDEQQQEQEGDQEEKEAQQDEQQQGQEEQESSASGQEQEEQQEGAPAEEAPEEELDRQSVEAILRSLEEQDQAEQRQMRSGPPDTRLRQEWW